VVSSGLEGTDVGPKLMWAVKFRKAVGARPAGFEGRFDLFGWYLIHQVFRAKKALGPGVPTLVDLGMGRGRDSIYFARRGFRVLGIDVSPVALEKAARRATRLKLVLPTQLADLRTYRLKGKFHVVFSSTALNHLPRTIRTRRFAHFKATTRPGGIHAVNVLISKPGQALAPDLEPGMAMYRPGELATYYRDWEIVDSRELKLSCRFGGSSHEHVVDSVVARRPA